MDDSLEILLHNVKQFVSYVWELFLVLGIIAGVLLGRFFRLFVPTRMKSLKGEIILITGAGNGIGRQTALHFSNLGAKIVCVDIETKANASTVDELSRTNTKAWGYTVDLGDIKAIRTMSAKVKAEVGDVTILINNAGIVPNGPFMEMRTEVEEKMFRVNVLSHFELLRQFMPKMIQRNHGHIVTIASIASFFPAKELAGYTSCKHANYGFIEALKQEMEDLPTNTKNINFTTVYPCFVRTRIMEGVTFNSKFPSNFPIVTPELVGKKVVEAVRRNEEHVFIPERASLLPLLRSIVPSAAKKRLQKGIFKMEVERNYENNNNNWY